MGEAGGHAALAVDFDRLLFIWDRSQFRAGFDEGPHVDGAGVCFWFKSHWSVPFGVDVVGLVYANRWQVVKNKMQAAYILI
jgi:hypothetical protein